MKTFFRIVVILLLTACNNHTENDAIKEFMPGTYVRFSQHEFGTENDTMVISLQNKTTSEYKIARRWKYERVLDGKAMVSEYKNTTTSAIFNEASKLLQETETCDRYSFDTRQKLLFAGSTKYQKQNK